MPERRRQVPVAMNRNPAILLLVALPVTGCGKQGIEYTHYVPLIFDGNNLVEQNDLKTKARLDRVEHVLTYYKSNLARQHDLAIEFSAPMDAVLCGI